MKLLAMRADATPQRLRAPSGRTGFLLARCIHRTAALLDTARMGFPHRKEFRLNRCPDCHTTPDAPPRVEGRGHTGLGAGGIAPAHGMSWMYAEPGQSQGVTHSQFRRVRQIPPLRERARTVDPVNSDDLHVRPPSPLRARCRWGLRQRCRGGGRSA